MQRAMVVRTYGNQDITDAMKSCIESMEIKRLRDEIAKKDYEIKMLQAQIGVANFAREKYYRQKIQEIPKKYHLNKKNPIRQKFWTLCGGIWLLIKN